MKPQESCELPYADIAVGLNTSILSNNEGTFQRDAMESMRQLLIASGYTVEGLCYDVGSAETNSGLKLETRSLDPAVLVISAKDDNPAAVIADEIRTLLQPLLDCIFRQSPNPLLIISRTVSKPLSQKVEANGQLTHHPLITGKF